MNTRFLLPKVDVVHGRRNVILRRCEGKRVLHLGCVDSGLLEERFARGELMHQQLASVANELWGVDIDREGISFLRARGVAHVTCADICREAEARALAREEFDIILATEVLEHLENPGMFLRAVGGIAVPGKTEFIVSVPNAFSINNLLNSVRGLEVVHPDHNYYFSYHTLTTLLRKSGFTVTSLCSYTWDRGSFTKDDNDETEEPPPNRAAGRNLRKILKRKARSLIAEALFRRSSFWGDGLIATCEIPVQALGVEHQT